MPAGSDKDTVLAQLTPFNVIFLVLPQRTLTTAENQAMAEFAGGFQKRLLFVGDNSGYSTQIGYLNNAITAQGVSLTTLWAYDYDDSQNYNQCPVVASNCLTQGVNYLWDRGCGGMTNPNVMFRDLGWNFVVGTGWQSSQADLTRTVISDRDVFNRIYGPNSAYNPSYQQSISYANAKFLDNLCTKW